MAGRVGTDFESLSEAAPTFRERRRKERVGVRIFRDVYFSSR